MKKYEEIADKSMYSNCCGAIPTSPLCENNTGFCSDCGEGASFLNEDEADDDSSFFINQGHVSEDWEDNNTDSFGQCWSDSEY